MPPTGRPQAYLFTRHEQIVIWTLSALLVLGLALGETLNRRKSATLDFVQARDGANLLEGRSQIESARQVNINTDSVWTLEALPGIGPELAKRIVQYRELHGPFQDPDDLLGVKGIGPTTLSRMKDRLLF